MKFVFGYLLFCFSAFAQFEYKLSKVDEKRVLTHLELNYSEKGNVFLPPTKIQNEVPTFKYDFELSKSILELRLRQLDRRLKTVKNLGEVKGQEYLRLVLNLTIEDDFQNQILLMNQELNQLKTALKSLEFYNEKFLLKEGSCIHFYFRTD